MNNFINLSAATLVVCLLLAPTVTSGEPSIEERIDELQRQIDELRILALEQDLGQEQEQQEDPRLQVTEVIRPTVADEDTALTSIGKKMSFGGQYRVNFYSAENDYDDPPPGLDDRQTSQRLRLRQNVDIAFNEQFKTHLQFELQNTSDNVTTTDQRRGGMSTEVSIRHAVMDYTFRTNNAFDGANAQVGIVPLEDYFHQALFSADWDYNPLAASFIVPAGSTSLRLFAANLQEGGESNADDDFIHYQADLTVPFGNEAEITLTGTALNIANSVRTGSSWHYNYGIGGHLPLGGFKASGFILGSSTNRALLGGNHDADGVAVLAELTGSVGPGNFGLLASYTTGEDDGTGFLMPMAFAQSFGYWGYTGILTVQGPTDTGFDFDGVNMSNNGYGMTSIQARYSFPVTEALTGYVSAGWFGNTDAGNRDSTVGTDLLAMGTYRFNRVLALDLGVSYARLKDSVSGYFQGVQNASGISGAGFNQPEGENRNKWAVFGRVQAEF